MHEMIRRRCEPQGRSSSLPAALIPLAGRFTYLAWTPYYPVSPRGGIDATIVPPMAPLSLTLETSIS
jgi:hypothetical protein